MSKKNKTSSKIKRFLTIFITLFVLLNIGIVMSGKTYLYKGIQYTYLKGKMGPGIYDSIIFPVRIAKNSAETESWTKSQQIELSAEAKELLKSTKTTSFLILKDGEIIHESYYEKHNESVKSNTFSMAKSFIGLLIGIAKDEGKIKSFDDLITDYMPFNLPGDEKRTIRHLLGMSSGLDWGESGANPLSDNAEAYYTSNLNELMQRQSFVGEPGSFEYKSGNSQLLGIILEQATGMSPTAYFEEKIWSKIGAENDFYWSLDQKDGEEKTFCCGYATTRDYAKMGQLLLNHGKWNQTSIIKSRTLTELTRAYNDSTTWYGLHFWIYPHPKHPAVYYRGILGQYIIVVPSLNAVLVRTGHKRKGNFSNTDGKAQSHDGPSTESYKEYHPMDLFDYLEVLEQVVTEAN